MFQNKIALSVFFKSESKADMGWQQLPGCYLEVHVVKGEPVGCPWGSAGSAGAVRGVLGHRLAKAAALGMAAPQGLAACSGAYIWSFECKR